MDNYKVMDLGNGLYRIGCQCSSEDCDTTMWVEADKRCENVSLFFFKKLTCWNYSNNEMFFKRFWNEFKFRLINACKIVFMGYVSVRSDIIIDGEDHYKNFLKALQESYKIAKGERNNEESVW